MNASHRTNPTTNPWDGDNVIAVSFEDDHEAYHALSLLKELDSQQRMGVQEAVVVRGEDGQLVEKDGTQSEYLAGTASGGLIGLLLEIIGGPFGVLIGGATGQRLGSLYDLADHEDTDSALGAISSSVQAGRTALLADVVEQSPESSIRPCPESAARYCGEPWTRSRPRSQSQRRPSTKPNAKAAKSCSVRTTSTTKRPSTQRSRS